MERGTSSGGVIVEDLKTPDRGTLKSKGRRWGKGRFPVQEGKGRRDISLRQWRKGENFTRPSSNLEGG